MHLSHHVVTQFPFVLIRNLKVQVAPKRFQLLDLLCGDPKSQLSLRFRKNNPQFTPQPNPMLCAEQTRHFPRCIAGDQWVFVSGETGLGIGHG
jgi:hypothetical protein